jgi:mono/diheme cytochrome c family protein
LISFIKNYDEDHINLYCVILPLAKQIKLKILFMKRVIGGLMILCGIALYSCQGTEGKKDNTENEVISNAEIPSTTMDGKPIADANVPAKSESGVDINAPSDSKGVGKFTSVKVGPGVDAALASKGSALFKTSCTACHTSTDQRLVGPGLKGITKIRTPEWIMNMITDPAKMTHNDPVAKALLEEFNSVQMTNQHVGDDGARAILEFLRENDGAK